MVRRLEDLSVTQPTNNLNQAEITEKHAPEHAAVFHQVEKLLQARQPKQALDLLARSQVHSEWARNATGVCLLRLGQTDRAVDIFRNLVISGGLFLRRDVPTAWKVNFATALLMAGHIGGCVGVLKEIPEQHHPGVWRLRAALDRWHERLSIWGKIRWLLGGQPAGPVELLPGEL
jgi:hypothetical protein